MMSPRTCLHAFPPARRAQSRIQHLEEEVAALRDNLSLVLSSDDKKSRAMHQQEQRAMRQALHEAKTVAREAVAKHASLEIKYKSLWRATHDVNYVQSVDTEEPRAWKVPASKDAIEKLASPPHTSPHAYASPMDGAAAVEGANGVEAPAGVNGDRRQEEAPRASRTSREPSPRHRAPSPDYASSAAPVPCPLPTPDATTVPTMRLTSPLIHLNVDVASSPSPRVHPPPQYVADHHPSASSPRHLSARDAYSREASPRDSEHTRPHGASTRLVATPCTRTLSGSSAGVQHGRKRYTQPDERLPTVQALPAPPLPSPMRQALRKAWEERP